MKGIEQFIKRLLVRILSFFSNAQKSPAGALGQTSFSKILVVVSDERMGELLLAAPLVRQLALLQPAAEIHLLHAAKFTWLAKCMPGSRVQMPFDKRATFKKATALLSFIQGLRREKYGLAVDGGKDDELSLTTALLMRASGAPVRLGHLREFTPFLTLAVERFADGLPEAARRVSLLRAFRDVPFDGRLRLTIGRSPATLVPMGLSQPKTRVAIYPGSRKPDHRIDPALLAEVARGLAGRGCEVSMVPGLGETELCNGIARASGAHMAPMLHGEAMCNLLASMDLFICNNTGPMHLSVALAVPTLGLFLKADPGRWGHSYSPHKVLDFNNSRPDAGKVLAAALEMLDSRQ
jgi:ADP-heptose:LPS heptosyltransferase